MENQLQLQVGVILVILAIIFVILVWLVVKLQPIFNFFASNWASSEAGHTIFKNKIKNYLRSDGSELEEHKMDSNAHVEMREKLVTPLDKRFDNLEAMILAAQSAQTEELNKFQTKVFDKLLSLLVGDK